MAEDERIGDVRGPGLMIGVELVRDRATKEPDGDLATALVARCAELGLLVLSCGLAHQVVRWIAADRRDAGRDQRGGRDLRRGPPHGLTATP